MKSLLHTLLSLALLLGISACNHEEGSNQENSGASATVDSSAAGTSSPQNTSPSIDTLAMLRTLKAEDAVKVVEDYYEALNEHAYEKAHGYWLSNERTSNQGVEGLRLEYEQAKSFTIKTGKPGAIKEADGSVEITIPLDKLTMAMTTGETYNLKGTYSLRGALINGEPQWKIHMIDIGSQ